MNIDDYAEKVVMERRRLLHLKVLELVLGDMVRDEGVKEVRKKLVWYARQLKHF